MFYKLRRRTKWRAYTVGSKVLLRRVENAYSCTAADCRTHEKIAFLSLFILHCYCINTTPTTTTTQQRNSLAVVTETRFTVSSSSSSSSRPSSLQKFNAFIKTTRSTRTAQTSAKTAFNLYTPRSASPRVSDSCRFQYRNGKISSKKIPGSESRCGLPPKSRVLTTAKMMIDTSSRIRTRCLIKLPRRMLRLVVWVLSRHAYLNRHSSINDGCR